MTRSNTPRRFALAPTLQALLMAGALAGLSTLPVASAQTSTPATDAAPAAEAMSPAPAAASNTPAAAVTPSAPEMRADSKHADRRNGAHHAHGDRAERMAKMQQRREARMAELKTKLQLTPAQESGWTAFTASAQRPDNARNRADWKERRAEMAKLTTPERLDRMQARQTERAAHFAQRAEATRSFYAGLTPEQQKTFDSETMHMGRGGHHRHHHDGQRGDHGDQPTKS